jgi:DNA modification methylase
MKFAYADPPYLGRAEYYRAHHADAMIWDKPETHQALIDRLQADYPDGWVMSLSERSLRTILPMCPPEARTGAWCTDRARYAGKAIPVRKHFEPVIFCGGRGYDDTGNRTADFIVTKQEPLPAGQPRYAMNKPDLRSGKTFVGRKPQAFSLWVLDLLGYLPGDTIDDLFPGSGAVQAAWASKFSAPSLFWCGVDVSESGDGK